MFWINYAVWTLLCVMWIAAVPLLQYIVRKKYRIWLHIVILIVKAVLAVAIAYYVLVTNVGFHFWTSYVLMSLYVVLMGDVFGDIIMLPVVIRKKRNTFAALHMKVCLVCTVVYLVYGMFNIAMVTGHDITFESDKLKNEYKVVFLADLHMGSAQSNRTIEKAVQKIKAEKPDLVLFGGDITDEFTSKEEMEQVLLLLGSIDAPKYYVYGNHDRQLLSYLTGGSTYSVEELDEALAVAGMNILRDEWVQVADDLVLFGREDINEPGRKAVEDIPERPEDAFVLLIDHTPYVTDEITASGADFQISGHTHAGQVFPLKWVYRAAGFDSFGYFKHGVTTVYVSSGIGGWGFPFRTEERCRYEVITLKP